MTQIKSAISKKLVDCLLVTVFIIITPVCLALGQEGRRPPQEIALPIEYRPLPCSFTWANVTVNGEQKNFSSPIKKQPYQGPCLTFAMVSMTESIYKIEHGNANISPKLSVPYLDYWSWGSLDFEYILETDSFAIASEPCGKWPAHCTNEQFQCYGLMDDVRSIISSGSCFDFETTAVEVGSSFEYSWNPIPINTDLPVIDYYSVNTVEQNIIFASESQIKSSIINSGPFVIKVQNNNYNPTTQKYTQNNVGLFNSYSTYEPFTHTYISSSSVLYHAYTVIGWKTILGQTAWHIQDPWIGSTYYSPPGIDLLDLINSNIISVSRVSEITKNGEPIANNWPDVELGPACSEIQEEEPILNVTLTCWDFGADKGGCLSADDGSSISTTWSTSGGAVSLFPMGNCVSISSSGFSGTLIANAIDSSSRTASDSCSF